MGYPNAKNNSRSTAERMGAAAFICALALALFDWHLAAIPLAILLAIYMAAPFFPALGFYLPIVSRGSSGLQAVAITVDDGPNPASTPYLLELFRKHEVHATFFVTGEQASAYPELILDILHNGHAIGNHSFNHDSLMMFRRGKKMERDIRATQDILHRTGIVPLAFRPPIGITSPTLGSVLNGMGMYVVNFSCRAFDGGNRRVDTIAKNILGRVKADDIVMFHDTKPESMEIVSRWLEEIENVLKGLSEAGLDVIPLSELIGRPVMKRVEANSEHTAREVEERRKTHHAE